MSRAQDPNTWPIGRQPTQVRIAPSKSYPWYGSIRGGRDDAGAIVDGERFTVEQQRALMAKGGDVPTAAALLVKRQATRDEVWWPESSLPPVYAFDCPVIGKRGDRIKVIAPNGDGKLVMTDGWAHRPYRIARDAFGYPL